VNLKKLRENHKKYGVDRRHKSLPPENHCSYGKVYSLCKKHQLLQRVKNKKNTTKEDKTQFAIGAIERDFKATVPNEKWLTDITQYQTKTGKLYVSPVLDCFDGAIVGLSMDSNMKAELCKQSLLSALRRYAIPQGSKISGLIIHSDRGSQYTSNKFRGTIHKYQLEQSMGRTGSCYDNTRMESFFSRLKDEGVTENEAKSLTREELARRIFKWIELEYNLTRITSVNEGYLPPLVKRAKYFHDAKQLAA